MDLYASMSGGGYKFANLLFRFVYPHEIAVLHL